MPPAATASSGYGSGMPSASASTIHTQIAVAHGTSVAASQLHTGDPEQYGSGSPGAHVGPRSSTRSGWNAASTDAACSRKVSGIGPVVAAIDNVGAPGSVNTGRSVASSAPITIGTWSTRSPPRSSTTAESVDAS